MACFLYASNLSGSNQEVTGNLWLNSKKLWCFSKYSRHQASPPPSLTMITLMQLQVVHRAYNPQKQKHWQPFARSHDHDATLSHNPARINSIALNPAQCFHAVEEIQKRLRWVFIQPGEMWRKMPTTKCEANCAERQN